MTGDQKKASALGLCSGGLDSILSALVLARQGIRVEWIAFETPFFSADNARRAAGRHGIPLTVQNITSDYLVMLKAPPAGYGKHMNPCMDCHAFMFARAGVVMAERGFDFLFSGEVLGQRPMSQNKGALRYVEKRSGHDGYILRPLSGKLLPATIPEQNGWVDRERLLDFSGRSRKPQQALAAELGVSEYPTPAGGCLLTEKGYADRLRDVMGVGTRLDERILTLLKYGRHLRLDADTRLIVGRNQAENEAIESLVDPLTDLVIRAREYPGPICVITGFTAGADVARAAAVCAGYGKAPAGKPAAMTVTAADGDTTVEVIPSPPAENASYLI